MKEFDKQSIDWNNFDEIDDNNPVEKSLNSQLFGAQDPMPAQSNKSRNKSSHDFSLDNSRDIGEISYIAGKDNNRSFKF